MLSCISLTEDCDVCDGHGNIADADFETPSLNPAIDTASTPKPPLSSMRGKIADLPTRLLRHPLYQSSKAVSFSPLSPNYCARVVTIFVPNASHPKRLLTLGSYIKSIPCHIIERRIFQTETREIGYPSHHIFTYYMSIMYHPNQFLSHNKQPYVT